MTHNEASALVAILAAAFPNSRFTAENATVYERAIADLAAEETKVAVDELIHSSERLPSVAAIRAEVMRQRRLEAEREISASHLLPAPRSGMPTPQEWGVTLARMLEEAAQYEARAKEWFAAKGKPYPGDPGRPFLELARAGARGEDVTEAAKALLNIRG